MKYNNIFL